MLHRYRVYGQDQSILEDLVCRTRAERDHARELAVRLFHEGRASSWRHETSKDGKVWQDARDDG